MITLSAQASAQRGFADLAAHGGITLAVAALSAVVFVCYGFAPMIAARIKPQTAHGVQRVKAEFPAIAWCDRLNRGMHAAAPWRGICRLPV